MCYFYSLQDLFGCITTQIVGHGVCSVQGSPHVQAANEVLGVVLVEVKGQLGHICAVLPKTFDVLIPGGAVLRGDERRGRSAQKLFVFPTTAQRAAKTILRLN